MTPEDLIALNEEIAGMARAGLPLDQGLAALAREMGRGRLQTVTAQIAADLAAGRTLPEALERQDRRVPPFYAGLVAAGIRSGRLPEILATLTVYARSLADLRATVVSAVIYPGIVLVLASGIFGAFCWFIVPQFQRIFQEFNLQLPAPTRFVLQITQHPILAALILSVWVVFILGLLRIFVGNIGAGRRAWTRMGYAIPVIGTMLRAMRLAAFTELLAILVDQEVPLPEAFRLAGVASSDPFMADGARQVQADLQEGMPLWSILRSRRLVPELVSWMTGLGERRGNLGKALHQVAAVYRRQVELRAALLRSVLPPFVLLGTAGIIVVYFIFIIVLPMTKLISGLTH